MSVIGISLQRFKGKPSAVPELTLYTLSHRGPDTLVRNLQASNIDPIRLNLDIDKPEAKSQMSPYFGSGGNDHGGDVSAVSVPASASAEATASTTSESQE